MIAHNMASAEAISNATVIRRNSLQGNQSISNGQKLPPIVSGANVGLNRKIQAQCKSSPPVKATSPSEVLDAAKLAGSVVHKKQDRLSS